MGPWCPTSRKVREKWGTLCRCGAYKYRGPSLGGLRLARRSPLPQDDKSREVHSSGAVCLRVAITSLPEQLSCAVPTMVQPPPQAVITLQLVGSNAKIEYSVLGPLGESH